MTAARLKSAVLVQAGLRRCSRRGIPATVVRKGDPDAGALYVKLNRLEAGCVVLNREPAADGALAWLRATGDLPVSEADADAYIGRQIGYDPDLWVIEIEDRDGINPFDDGVGAP